MIKKFFDKIPKFTYNELLRPNNDILHIIPLKRYPFPQDLARSY